MNNRTSGFTLIELMLSIAFLGTLMVFVTMATVQAISIYNKGLAMKQINQAGRALIEDLNRLSSSGFLVSVDDNGSKGYLCVDFTSNTRAYIWNSIQKGQGGTAPLPADTGKFIMDTDNQPISLVRSDDAVNAGEGGSDYCTLAPAATNRTVANSDVTPLLTPQVRVLSVDIVTGTTPTLKKIAFWLGTSDGTVDGTNVPGMQPTWDATNKTWACEGGRLGDFCAVSKFETILYTPNVE